MSPTGRPPSSDRLMRRQIPQPALGTDVRRIPAWLASICFHLIVFTTLATLWTTRSAGTGQETGGAVGIAVVYESVDGEAYFLADGNEASNADGAASPSLAESLPSQSEAGSFQSSLLEGLLPTGDGSASDAVAAAGTLGLGDGQGELGGNRQAPKVKTSVFGVEGEGTRFLYVFDRSDSMNGYEGRPLSIAKAELLESLGSLGPAHEFQIIFYNDTPLPFGGFSGRPPQLFRGDENSKLNAQRFVRGMVAIGGTQHIDALRMAVGMGPDVIFFLTDADFPAPSSRELENLYERAARAGTTIHTIQFGSGSNQGSGSWIQSLAEGTLGKFRYVDVTKF